MATEPLPDPWQEFARELLQDAIAQRGLNFPRLAALLAENGYDVKVKTLARRVNRGTFDAGFLLMCLTVLGTERVDFYGERFAEVWLQRARASKLDRPRS